MQETEKIMATISIIGAGNVGAQVARASIRTGKSVVLANSRHGEGLDGLVAELGERAIVAASVADAVKDADIVVVALPINAYAALPADAFVGKVVIDTGNYYPAWNGNIPELDDERTTTSELLQAALPGASVVKALNNLSAADLTTDGSPAGSSDRRALAIAGDDLDAKVVVRELIDSFGFDVVDVGPLAEGWRFQRDLPAYGVRRNATQMREALAKATRYRDQAKPAVSSESR
ncbi:NAD(P)-binding domain-containing protein [Promicromonospora sp. NPDC050249]|uniref:NADPH-dependent F420 reductase n=1 Tax=Promicromonospora sp. NPDC050249 TaxID=3154743 RepID=UPI00340253E5